MSVRASLRSVALSPLGERALRVVGRRVLTCIGDSHLEPLRIVQQQKLLPHTVLRLTTVGGATASGILNPNSRTAALPRFQAACATLRNGSTLLSCLGEVDAGFLVFALASKHGTTPVVQADLALDRYKEFLDREVLQRRVSLLMVSVVPPTVEDYSDWVGLRGQRRDISANWQERADMTRYWNEECQKWCVEAGGHWLDLASQVSDPETGRVRDEWMNPDVEDHHLEPVKHAALLAKLLAEHDFR